jgi:proteic killer suppression protein
VIKSFADKLTQELYVSGKARRLPSEILARALRKLEQINAATVLGDLSVPPSNRLHGLGDDRKGRHSISINEQWRVCFRFVDGDAYDVEICDYH